jgi:PleD family two-component response regulator
MTPNQCDAIHNRGTDSCGELINDQTSGRYSQGSITTPFRESLLSTWRVLLAENDAHEMEALAYGLRRLGHEAESASTASSALQIYQHADIVLLDAISI